MTDRPRPHLDYEEEPEGYPGASCHVCAAPASLRVRCWRNPRGGGGHPVGAREMAYFCADHRDTADRQDAALRAPDCRPGTAHPCPSAVDPSGTPATLRGGPSTCAPRTDSPAGPFGSSTTHPGPLSAGSCVGRPSERTSWDVVCGSVILRRN